MIGIVEKETILPTKVGENFSSSFNINFVNSNHTRLGGYHQVKSKAKFSESRSSYTKKKTITIEFGLSKTQKSDYSPLKLFEMSRSRPKVRFCKIISINF